MEKWNDAAANHRELYALLSQAEYRFTEAIAASISSLLPSNDDGAKAGRKIFQATLNALTQYEWEGNLPLIRQYPNYDTDRALLPPPILVALAYCLDSAQKFSLFHFSLTCGQPLIDRTVISWPATLLKGFNDKDRFFADLSDFYTTTPTDLPFLSDTQTRAVQLLVIGRHLIKGQKNKIGLPLHPKILTP